MPHKKDNEASLYYFMFDPVWGIFCDESYIQDNKNWNYDIKEIQKAMMNHIIEGAIDD